jgi:LmbE family N-acetylglucosaminyl deacetylase
MDIFPIQNVIPEANIVMFAPHYDDFLLGLGGYVLELREQDLLSMKRFHVLLLFSRSNYGAGNGAANFDSGLERIKFATGRRLIEELDCLDELLGVHNYRYELLGERECFLRGKTMADSEMEFPHGMYADFNEQDRQIFARLQALVHAWAGQPDTALVFPLAIKEHIDHFLAREAGITVARQLGRQALAHFYFQEDKPYAGIQTTEEEARIEKFVKENDLQPRIYRGHPELIVELAFKHYTSQVEDVYRKGVMQRAAELRSLYGLVQPADRLFAIRTA